MTKKYERPLEPLTQKVQKNIEAKLKMLYSTYKTFDEFGNVDKKATEEKRKDLAVRLISAALKAYDAYSPETARSGYETFAAGFVENEIKKYRDDLAKEIDRQACTLSADAEISPHAAPADNEHTPCTYLDRLTSPRHNALSAALLDYDVASVLRLLARLDQRSAFILAAIYQDFTYEQIAYELNTSENYVKTKLMPRSRQTFKLLYLRGTFPTTPLPIEKRLQQKQALKKLMTPIRVRTTGKHQHVFYRGTIGLINFI